MPVEPRPKYLCWNDTPAMAHVPTKVDSAADVCVPSLASLAIMTLAPTATPPRPTFVTGSSSEKEVLFRVIVSNMSKERLRCRTK